MPIFSCFKKHTTDEEVAAYFRGELPKPSLKQRIKARLRKIFRSPRKIMWDRRIAKVEVLLKEYYSRKAAIKEDKLTVKGLDDIHCIFEKAEKAFADAQAAALEDATLEGMVAMFEKAENMWTFFENVRLTNAMYQFNLYYVRQLREMHADLTVLAHEIALTEFDLGTAEYAAYVHLKDWREVHTEMLDQAEYQLLLNENRMLTIFTEAEKNLSDSEKIEKLEGDMITLRVDNLVLEGMIRDAEKSMNRHALHNLFKLNPNEACRLINNGFRY